MGEYLRRVATRTVPPMCVGGSPRSNTEVDDSRRDQETASPPEAVDARARSWSRQAPPAHDRIPVRLVPRASVPALGT